MEEQNIKGHDAKLLVGLKKSDNPNVFQIPFIHSQWRKYFKRATEILQWPGLLEFDSLFISRMNIIKSADVIHLHNLHGDYFSLFTLLSLKGKKIVWTLHDMHGFTGHCAHSFDCNKWRIGCGKCPKLDTYPSLKKDTSAFLWMTRKVLFSKLNISIVTPSNWLLELVNESYLRHLDSTLIYNGVDTSIYQFKDKTSCRNHLGIPLNKKVILFSAELGVKNIYKGGKYIERLVKDQELEDVLFINIGGDKTLKKDNSWNVQYVSDELEMSNYYNASDVYLYPSLADNCPLVLLEAISCGLKVVSFNIGGIPEIVNDEKIGFISDKDDFKSLKDNFNKVLNEIENDELLGNIKTDKIDFALERMMSEYEVFYFNN